MSERLVAKLRQNDDFRAVTRYLDDEGLPWRVYPGGKHPKIEIVIGPDKTLRRSLTCSPGSVNIQASLRYLRHAIQKARGE